MIRKMKKMKMKLKKKLSTIGANELCLNNSTDGNSSQHNLAYI